MYLSRWHRGVCEEPYAGVCVRKTVHWHADWPALRERLQYKTARPSHKSSRCARCPQASKQLPEVADTLDSLMELTLQHPAQRCAAAKLRPLWTALLGALDRALLATHRSKFTQFLLWFIAQQRRAYRVRVRVRVRVGA